jgi:hypothetical protein
MHFMFQVRGFSLLLIGLAVSVSAQTPVQSTSAPPAPVPAVADTSGADSARAHALLDRVVKINGPSVEGAAPWHLKADFQWQMLNQPIESGTLEEWWKGPDQWRRTYTMKKTVWTEWSQDRAHQFQSGFFFYRSFADLRIATPLITPLFQAKNFLPEYPMQVQPGPSGTDLSCISIADPGHYAGKIDPDFLFPKYCLDRMGVLRGVVTSNTLVSWSDFTVFDKRAVAKTVDVFVDGHKMSESKVSVLEPLAPSEEALLQPDKGAAPQPFAPTASDPRPVLLHSEKPIIPAAMVIAGGGGPVSIAVVIDKDGKVRPSGLAMGTRAASLGIVNASAEAARGFRYQPYLIDGQPVEVAWNIAFSFGTNGYIPPPPGEDDKPTGYDPKRDPAADLKAAEAEAQQAHKHIILEVGGDWCIWCAYMDKFFAHHADIDALLQANYVVVKVNWSQENHNDDFLQQYAMINSFPFLIVLDENGKLLRAQRTNVLEAVMSYDPGKMKDFLNHWKPGAPTTTASLIP